MKKTLIIIFLILLSACSATPKVNIIDSMGMTMELNQSAKSARKGLGDERLRGRKGLGDVGNLCKLLIENCEDAGVSTISMTRSHIAVRMAIEQVKSERDGRQG